MDTLEKSSMSFRLSVAMEESCHYTTYYFAKVSRIARDDKALKNVHIKYYSYVIFLIFILVNSANNALAMNYVSVAPFTGQNIDKNLAIPELMSELVLTCLSADSSIAVVERADLAPVMTEKSMKITGISNTTTGKELKLNGVQYLITGSVTDMEGKWLLSLQVNNVASTQIIASHSSAINTNHLAADICTKVTKPLIEKFLHTPSNSVQNQPVESSDESKDSTLLMQGISYVNNGDYAKSFPMFLKILDRTPRHADAKYWLTISYAKAGLTEFAQMEAAQYIAEFPENPRSKALKIIATTPSKKEKKP